MKGRSRHLSFAFGIALSVAPRHPASASPANWPPRFAPPVRVSTGAGSAPVGLRPASVYHGGTDLVVADAVRGLILIRNDGQGNFRENAFMPAGSSPTCVGVGSLNAVPTASLGTANMLDTFFSVFIPDASGRYGREDVPLTSSPQSIALVDLPGEPSSLIAVGISVGPNHGNVLFYDRAGRSWRKIARVDLPWLPMGIIPYHAKDRPLELAVSPTSGFSVGVVRVKDRNTLELEQLLPASHLIVAAWGAPAPDGALVVGVGLKKATVWRCVGQGSYELVAELDSEYPLTGATLQDLNGDGYPEIIASGTLAIEIWPGNPDGSFGPAMRVAAANRGFSPVTADFDGDGRPDLAWVNSVWRAVSIMRNVTPAAHPGDGDGDGIVDTTDVVMALQYAVGLNDPAASPDIAARLDVRPVRPDGDWGDSEVNVEDAVQILKWTLNVGD